MRCLLIEPFAESALNEEAGRLLLEDYEAFAKQARLMAQIHAMPAKRPAPLKARPGVGNCAPFQSPSKADPQQCRSPVTKKAKGDCKGPGPGSTAAKKRAMRRL